jgi:hypothetical protein
MKLMNRKARAFLLAAVTDTVCEHCECVPAMFGDYLCGPCFVREQDATRNRDEARRWR